MVGFGLQVTKTGFDHFVPVSRICVIMSSREMDVESPSVTNRIVSRNSHTLNSLVPHFVDMDNMIKACSAEDA